MTDFQQRYDSATPTYTKVNDKQFADLPAGTTVLIPSPQDIEAEINRIEAGQTIELTELRHRLAARHDADGCCPVMTGMNLRVVAELSFDALDAGVPVHDVVPVWRAVSPTSTPAKKRPGAPELIERLRASDRPTIA